MKKGERVVPVSSLLVPAFSIRDKNYLCQKLQLYDYPEIQRGLGKHIFGLPASAVKKVRGRKRVRILGLSASRVCHSGMRGPLMSRELVVLPTKSLAVLY